MLRMARMFGLTQQEIAEHEWMGTWIIENCDSCDLGGVCFLNKNGDFVDDPGIDVKQCPNLKIYKNIAKELGKRAPIKNHLS
ncbi:MAG: hypothetical protein COC12_14600 [Rhodobacteraceae bacterium]|nr:MAG: hypothetical protein COC12_14600 [Paracoccaceae bacterium]